MQSWPSPRLRSGGDLQGIDPFLLLKSREQKHDFILVYSEVSTTESSVASSHEGCAV